MREGEGCSGDSTPTPRQAPTPFLNHDTSVAIYTVLSILMKMRSTLGLEAMLDYTERYLSIIAKHNPQFESAVTQVMARINIEKIYKDVWDEKL